MKVTEPLRFFFCRFLLESAAGLFLVCVAAPRLSIWIFTFQKFRKVAQGFGVGRMTVQRFIRLTELIPPILQMVDEGKIALTPAVELSFLKKDEQENLFATMESEEATPSLSQAQRMKSMSQSGQLDMDMIFSIMTEEKGNQKETLKINTSKLKKYFPKDTTPKQMEETIIRLLERELQRKRSRDSR